MNFNFKYKQLEEIKNIIPILATQSKNNELTLVVSVDNLYFSLKVLKNHLSYSLKCSETNTNFKLIDLIT